MVEFEHFFGIDGELYFEEGKTLDSKHYLPVGIRILAVPKNTNNVIIKKAIEYRCIKQSNAYVRKCNLVLGSDFNLANIYGNGVSNSNDYNILSILYIRDDEKALKYFKD